MGAHGIVGVMETPPRQKTERCRFESFRYHKTNIIYMEKIFDYDFRNELFLCLRESGIKDKEIREIIRKRYKESLKDEVVERLNTVIKAIKEDNLEEIIPFIGDSPSGDGYGCDNRYISFKDVTDCEDIGDVIDALMEK